MRVEQSPQLLLSRRGQRGVGSRLRAHSLLNGPEPRFVGRFPAAWPQRRKGPSARLNRWLHGGRLIATFATPCPTGLSFRPQPGLDEDGIPDRTLPGVRPSNRTPRNAHTVRCACTKRAGVGRASLRIVQREEFLVSPVAYMPPMQIVDGLSATDAARRVPGIAHTIVEVVAPWCFGRRGCSTGVPASTDPW